MNVTGYKIENLDYCLVCADDATAAAPQLLTVALRGPILCSWCGVDYTPADLYGAAPVVPPPAPPPAPRRGLRIVKAAAVGVAVAMAAPAPVVAAPARPVAVVQAPQAAGGWIIARPVPAAPRADDFVGRVWRAQLLDGAARQEAARAILADIQAMAARELAAVNEQRERAGAAPARSLPMIFPVKLARDEARALLR